MKSSNVLFLCCTVFIPFLGVRTLLLLRTYWLLLIDLWIMTSSLFWSVIIFSRRLIFLWIGSKIYFSCTAWANFYFSSSSVLYYKWVKANILLCGFKKGWIILDLLIDDIVLLENVNYFFHTVFKRTVVHFKHFVQVERH